MSHRRILVVEDSYIIAGDLARAGEGRRAWQILILTGQGK
jgi:hypothetical protein